MLYINSSSTLLCFFLFYFFYKSLQMHKIQSTKKAWNCTSFIRKKTQINKDMQQRQVQTECTKTHWRAACQGRRISCCFFPFISKWQECSSCDELPRHQRDESPRFRWKKSHLKLSVKEALPVMAWCGEEKQGRWGVSSTWSSHTALRWYSGGATS